MTGTRHPRHRLDPVIHFPVRLSIMACLAEVAEAEFKFVMDTVELTAASLSKQVSILEDSGYVAVRKGYVGRRPRTWLALTTAGRDALADHLDALRAIASPPEASTLHATALTSGDVTRPGSSSPAD
jgi:DNA-binding MarR family transcriptional regulator